MNITNRPVVQKTGVNVKANVSERRHMAIVASHGCIVCQVHLGIDDSPSEVHHCRTTVGWGRDGHMNTIPLCREHHRGNTGVHAMGSEQFKGIYGYSEIELLDLFKQKLGIL